jgi:hypothetical protein
MVINNNSNSAAKSQNNPAITPTAAQALGSSFTRKLQNIQNERLN